MEQFFSFITSNSAALAILGAVAASVGTALWTMLQYARAQAQEREKRVFDTYHKLVHELVHGDANGNVYIDRQCAIVYELRFYRRYHPVTRRILIGLKQGWSTSPLYLPRLGKEIDLTVAKTKGWLWDRN